MQENKVVEQVLRASLDMAIAQYAPGLEVRLRKPKEESIGIGMLKAFFGLTKARKLSFRVMANAGKILGNDGLGKIVIELEKSNCYLPRGTIPNKNIQELFDYYKDKTGPFDPNHTESVTKPRALPIGAVCNPDLTTVGAPDIDHRVFSHVDSEFNKILKRNLEKNFLLSLEEGMELPKDHPKNPTVVLHRRIKEVPGERRETLMYLTYLNFLQRQCLKS